MEDASLHRGRGIRNDGSVTIRRADGAIAWPVPPAALSGRPALTFFGADVRRPRAFKADLSLSQQIGSGTTVTVGGGYRHTDYMLQRTDINRVPAPVTTLSDGRSVFGSLRQLGSVIGPMARSIAVRQFMRCSD